MTVTVECVDILDDREPNLLVQLWHYPSRTYQVIRKRAQGEPPFGISQGVEVDESLSWRVPVYFVTGDEDDDDELGEVYAVVYDHEKSLPFDMHKVPEDHLDPLANVVFDQKTQRFYGEFVLNEASEVGDVSDPSLGDAIVYVLDALEDTLTANA
jgi:hypothetical protein